MKGVDIECVNCWVSCWVWMCVYFTLGDTRVNFTLGDTWYAAMREEVKRIGMWDVGRIESRVIEGE